AAVSGSASVAAGMAYTHKTPSESINHIAPLINKSLLSDFSMIDLALALKRKTQHGQSISFIDLFGSLMAQRTFKGLGIDHPSSIDLATYASQIDPLKSPLPIQTSIIGNNTSGKYEWVEFTPFEIGSTFLNTFIPSWAFGRKFENGFSTDFTPPQSLAFCMGLWGSAMCANPHDFFKIRIAPELDPIVSSFLAPQLEQLFTRPPFSNVRLSPAHVFNWNLGMQNATLNKHKTLTLVDAGFDSNFPLPPLLRSERAVDIIIMIDASTIRANELRDAEKNMLHRGLDMPSIDYGIIDQPCSIHHDSLSPNKSTIVYIPLVKNPSYHDNWDPCKEKFTDIFNFRYTQHQTHALSGLMKHNMAQSMPMIIDTIRQWIKKKNH
ncbi:MAG: hypothetical protein P4L31_02470, partial [Candidatus Babeliales bacterium]|nr:hypothetical protein [Candidatus Babeliales bacterium]